MNMRNSSAYNADRKSSNSASSLLYTQGGPLPGWARAQRFRGESGSVSSATWQRGTATRARTGRALPLQRHQETGQVNRGQELDVLRAEFGKVRPKTTLLARVAGTGA